MTYIASAVIQRRTIHLNIKSDGAVSEPVRRVDWDGVMLSVNFS